MRIPGTRRWRGRQRRPTPAGLAHEQRRLRLALAAFGAVLLAGFVGYQLVADATPLDALYMTVITITTVGFGEIIELDSASRVLTILLIVGGVGSGTYAALTAAEFLVEGHLRNSIERRRMSRQIGSLKDHTIVCGFGRVGRHLADQLHHEGAEFVVIDNDDAKIDILDELGYLHVRGDATEEAELLEAGLERARSVVACVNTDADNVLVTLTAKGLNPRATVIARTKADENEGKLRRAGADRVIAPATIGGRRIAQILTRPAVADFLDGLGIGGVEYMLEEVPVSGDGSLAGHTLREAGIRERFGCTVLAIRRAGEPGLDTHPDAQTPLAAGDTIVVMGSESDVTRMRSHFTEP